MNPTTSPALPARPAASTSPTNPVLPKPVPENIHQELSDFPEATRTLLYRRGIDTKEKARDFIYPKYDRAEYDPFILADMEKAVDRIKKAVDGGQKIVIFSDYDHDGIPAAVILSDFFRKIAYGHNVSVYIPHRHHEGFGLNNAAIEKFSEQGVSLIITADCGIADHHEVDFANSKNIDVIITDHHEVGAIFPKAYAVVNPKRKDCAYQEKMLCGAGVAYKVIQGYLKKYTDPKIVPGWEKWLLDMVGIATLSDMVPLVGENRAFAHFGLQVLRKSPRLGIKVLSDTLKIQQRFISEDDVGFSITPRINATSRMGEAMDAFNLLSSTNREEAINYVKKIEIINKERKGVVASLVKEIKHHLESIASSAGTTDRDNLQANLPEIIFLGSTKWRPSLLGLVANNFMEQYKRPVFLWGEEGNSVIKGSCRSDGTVNLVELMSALPKNAILDFGGHAMAGGFSVDREKLPFLANHLIKCYKKQKISKDDISQVVDLVISIKDVNEDKANHINMVGPFGLGNHKPVLLLPEVRVYKIEHFGKIKEHIKIHLDDGLGSSCIAVNFFANKNPSLAILTPGQTVSLLCHLEKSYFMGRSEVRLRILEVLSGVPAQVLSKV